MYLYSTKTWKDTKKSSKIHNSIITERPENTRYSQILKCRHKKEKNKRWKYQTSCCFVWFKVIYVYQMQVSKVCSCSWGLNSKCINLCSIVHVYMAIGYGATCWGSLHSRRAGSPSCTWINRITSNTSKLEIGAFWQGREKVQFPINLLHHTFLQCLRPPLSSHWKKDFLVEDPGNMIIISCSSSSL